MLGSLLPVECGRSQPGNQWQRTRVTNNWRATPRFLNRMAFIKFLPEPAHVNIDRAYPLGIEPLFSADLAHHGISRRYLQPGHREEFRLSAALQPPAEPDNPGLQYVIGTDAGLLAQLPLHAPDQHILQGCAGARRAQVTRFEGAAAGWRKQALASHIALRLVDNQQLIIRCERQRRDTHVVGQATRGERNQAAARIYQFQKPDIGLRAGNLIDDPVLT